MVNYVYVLYAGTRTYTGYTNNPVRRLRQHCGIIKGGAKSTSGRSDWQFLTLTTCDTWDAIRALQTEYKFKHPTGKRQVPAKFRGPKGRVNALTEICKRVPDAMTMQVCSEYFDVVKALELPAHITIVPMCLDTLTA